MRKLDLSTVVDLAEAFILQAEGRGEKMPESRRNLEKVKLELRRISYIDPIMELTIRIQE